MRIAIVDDQREYHQIYKEKLKKIVNDDSSIYCFNNPTELDESHIQFHLILMDIDMPTINGIEYARKNENKNIIFITNHSNYMKNAFGRNVYAFIEKQDSDEEFYQKITETINSINKEKFVDIKTKEGEFRVFQKDIIYIQYIDRRTICIKLKDVDYKVKGYGLNEFLSKLESNFLLCDKDIIINVDKIIGITNDNQLIVKGIKNKINVSTRRMSKIKEKYYLRYNK